jgi:hypothetical protein
MASLTEKHYASWRCGKHGTAVGSKEGWKCRNGGGGRELLVVKSGDGVKLISNRSNLSYPLVSYRVSD